MLKKIVCVLGVTAGILISASTPAHAGVTLYDSYSAWTADPLAGSIGSLALYQIPLLPTIAPLNGAVPAGTDVGSDPDRSAKFNIDLSASTVPAGLTWSNVTPTVILDTLGANSATGTFNGGSGPIGFGLEMMPLGEGTYDLTFSAGGSSETRSVLGGTAQFFGFASDAPLSSFTMTTNAGGMDFGNISYYEKHDQQGTPTPEPASLILLTLGGAGLALLRKTGTHTIS